MGEFDLRPIEPIKPGNAGIPGKIGQTEPERSFKEILEDAISKVNQMQVDADESLAKLARGEATIDEVMVSFQKARISFESLMQIRNKLVSAFEEISRMRI